MKTEDIDILLRTLVIKRASDLHLQVGTPPVFRVFGNLHFSDLEPLSEEDIAKYIDATLSEAQKEEFERYHRVDLSYSIPGIARFRMNVFKQRGQTSLALRVIVFEVPTMERLKLPEVLKDFATKPHGLVLVTGPTGSGKSTTLAAMINYINETHKRHIMTIEDPIEFVHVNKQSLVDQREVGSDTPSFSMALRDALREDPDVILVGEMRDLDTISNAITAAETGHLVLATLHTNDAAHAADRMISVFPAHQQAQVRTQLANSIQGICAQVLLRKQDGSGRVPALEIMVANTAIRSLIRERKTEQIINVIQTGRKEGMVLLKDSLKALCDEGLVSVEEVESKMEYVEFTEFPSVPAGTRL